MKRHGENSKWVVVLLIALVVAAIGVAFTPERGDRRASGVRSRSARSCRRPAAGFCQLNRAFAGSLALM